MGSRGAGRDSAQQLMKPVSFFYTFKDILEIGKGCPVERVRFYAGYLKMPKCRQIAFYSLVLESLFG